MAKYYPEGDKDSTINTYGYSTAQLLITILKQCGDDLTRDNVMVGLTLVPIAIASNYAGIWMVRRVSTEMFFRIAYVLMFVIAVELIRQSVMDLWWG